MTTLPAGPKKTFGLSQDGHRICHVADQGVGYHDIRTSVPNIDAVGVSDAKLDPGGNILLFGELTSSFDQILTDVDCEDRALELAALCDVAGNDTCTRADLDNPLNVRETE